MISDVTVSDVSTCACRLIWQTDRPATPSLAVFTDSGGTVPAAGVTITNYPGFGTDQLAPVTASDFGLMSVEITGLLPNTFYYVRGTSTALDDSSTASTALIAIHTAAQLAPLSGGASPTPITNPVLRFNCLDESGDFTAVSGALTVSINGSRTAVSGFVNGHATVYLDLGNLISDTTGRTLPVLGGEPMTLKFHRGLGQVDVFQMFAPGTDGLATVRDPRLTPAAITSPVVRPFPGTAKGPARVFIEFPAIPGVAYQLETSETLRTGEWEKIDGFVADENRYFFEDNGRAETPAPPSATPRRFYRLIPQP